MYISLQRIFDKVSAFAARSESRDPRMNPKGKNGKSPEIRQMQGCLRHCYIMATIGQKHPVWPAFVL
jgi:hypothetical protein